MAVLRAHKYKTMVFAYTSTSVYHYHIHPRRAKKVLTYLQPEGTRDLKQLSEPKSGHDEAKYRIATRGLDIAFHRLHLDAARRTLLVLHQLGLACINLHRGGGGGVRYISAQLGSFQPIAR